MHVHEVPFVVVDTETTGVRAGSDRVIEVAAVKVQDGAVVDRFSSLINPQRSVPHRITRMTGISTAMLVDEPRASAVLPRFLDFLGSGVFVAHNMTFDQRFLDAELARLGRRALQNETLCTLRLARRLLPGLSSKALGHVASHYGIRIEARHRAMGDADATARILLRFFEQLTTIHEVETVADVLRFQYRTYGKTTTKRRPSHVKRIRAEVLPALPPRPGVYFMKNEHGGILYIGKAKDLSARVRTYFTAIEAHAPRLKKLVKAVREVEWEETGSELAALLLESRLIKEHTPPFNRAQTRYRNRPFLRLDTSERFPRLTTTGYIRDDGAEYFGPLTSRRSAERVVEIVDRFFRLRECDDDTFRQGRRCFYAEIDRCRAPCVGGEAAAGYDDQVQHVRRFLMGHDASIVENLEVEMQAAADRLDFEQAAAHRDGLRTVERLMQRQQCVAAPVLDHNAVVVQPGIRAGTVQLFLIRFGRLVETITLPPPARRTDGDVEALRHRFADLFDPSMERPERYFKREADELRLLLHWLYVNRDSAEKVAWQPSSGIDIFLDDVMAEVARVGTVSAAAKAAPAT